MTQDADGKEFDLLAILAAYLPHILTSYPPSSDNPTLIMLIGVVTNSSQHCFSSTREIVSFEKCWEGREIKIGFPNTVVMY